MDSWLASRPSSSWIQDMRNHEGVSDLESRFRSCQVSYLLGILPREASLYISASFLMQLKLTDKHGPQWATMKFLPGERQNFKTVSLFSFFCVLSILPFDLSPWKNSGENISTEWFSTVSIHSESSSSSLIPQNILFTLPLSLNKKVEKIWQ